MAIISAPFTYGGKFVESRHRHPTETRLQDTVLLDIEDLTSAQAPIAVRCQSPVTVDDVVEIRWDGQNFWTELLDPDRDFIKAEDFARVIEAAAAARSVWPEYPFPREMIDDKPGGLTPGQFLNKKSAGDYAIKQWVKTDREDRLTAALRAAQNMRAIDGVLFVRCAEPTLRLEFSMSPGADLFVDIGQPSLKTEWVRFRIDSFDDVMTVGERLSPRLKSRLELARPEVLLPEALMHDEVAEIARNMRTQLLPRVAELVGGMKSPQTMRLWADLMEACDAWEGKDHAEAQRIVNLALEFTRADQTQRPGRVDCTGHALVYGEGIAKSNFRYSPLLIAAEHLAARAEPEPDAQALSF